MILPYFKTSMVKEGGWFIWFNVQAEAGNASGPQTSQCVGAHA